METRARLGSTCNFKAFRLINTLAKSQQAYSGTLTRREIVRACLSGASLCELRRVNIGHLVHAWNLIFTIRLEDFFQVNFALLV